MEHLRYGREQMCTATLGNLCLAFHILSGILAIYGWLGLIRMTCESKW